MQKVLRKSGQVINDPGVVAYSFETEEECSAAPGDYFHFGPDDCLKDSEGNDMVLVRVIKTTVYQPIED